MQELHPPIRALIFDMDGLLVDSEPLAEAAMTAFLRRYGREPRAEVAAQLLGRRLPEALAIVREAYELALPIDELIAIYGEMRLASLRGNEDNCRCTSSCTIVNSMSLSASGNVSL